MRLKASYWGIWAIHELNGDHLNSEMCRGSRKNGILLMLLPDRFFSIELLLTTEPKCQTLEDLFSREIA